MMDMSQFEDHLDLYGGDLAAWPLDLRLAATALMATSIPARTAFRAMGDVETFVRGSAVVVSDGADAMAARAMQHRQLRTIPVAAWRGAWATAAAAALVLGLFVGDVTPRHEETPDPVVATALDSMGSVDVD